MPRDRTSLRKVSTKLRPRGLPDDNFGWTAAGTAPPNRPRAGADPTLAQRGLETHRNTPIASVYRRLTHRINDALQDSSEEESNDSQMQWHLIQDPKFELRTSDWHQKGATDDPRDAKQNDEPMGAGKSPSSSAMDTAVTAGARAAATSSPPNILHKE